MKIYVYLDESGSIHKNSNANHFAIGGYIVYGDRFASSKVINRYKRINKKHKKIRNMSMSEELKTRSMSIEEKLELISKIQKIDNFYGCAIIFDKAHMRKRIENQIFSLIMVSRFYSRILFCIITRRSIICFILSVDNRNITVGDLDDLEKFLSTEFCYFDYTFSVTYYDSATHYGIQLADLIVNTMYMRSKNRTLVEPVLNALDIGKFRLNIFPGFKMCGRISKINFESSELTKVR